MLNPSDLIKCMHNLPSESVDSHLHAVDEAIGDLLIGIGVIGSLAFRAAKSELEGEEALCIMSDLGTTLTVMTSLIRGLNAAQIDLERSKLKCQEQA